MVSVKNISEGPRFINSKSGTVLIQSGEIAELDLEKADREMAELSDWFEFSGGETAKKPASKKAD